MRVRVLFFGILKELVGKSVDLIDLPERASVRDVLARYESQIPGLKESLPSLALAVNQQYAAPDTESVSYTHLDVYKRQVLTLFQQIVAGSPTLSDELSTVAMNIDCLLYTSRCV